MEIKMVCPHCESSNVMIQTFQENNGSKTITKGKTVYKEKKHGCLWWLFIGWWFMIFDAIFWILFFIPRLLIRLGRRKKYVSKTKTTATNRIRMNKPIELAAGHYYSFEFTNNTEYSAYAYIYNKRTNKLYSHGWFIHGYTTFADEDMQMYLSFRRNVNGTDVNLEPDEIPEFKILQYEKLNTSTSYEDFKYELVTKTKINVVDKRDEIEDGNYYISIYDENHTLLNEVAYNELAGDLISVENIIKEIELEEHKSYSVELRIKIRDRYYTLSYVDLTTDEEILGISTIDEWKKIQPNGNYIILNDLDLINYTEQRLGW
jgi:hypothetical protein